MSRLSLLYDVHRVSYLSHELVEDSLVGQELSGTEFALYSFLVVHGPATVTEVASGIAASPASTSKLLARVDERAHLTRRPNPDDGRSTFVELNDAGRRAHAAARPGFGTALNNLLEELGGSEDDVRWALTRLDDALSSALQRPKPPQAEGRPGHRLLSYQGAPLTADEEDEARRFIGWLRYQRQQG